MSETETTLTIIPECFIYKVPPRTSVASYKYFFQFYFNSACTSLLSLLFIDICFHYISSTFVPHLHNVEMIYHHVSLHHSKSRRMGTTKLFVVGKACCFGERQWCDHSLHWLWDGCCVCTEHLQWTELWASLGQFSLFRN